VEDRPDDRQGRRRRDRPGVRADRDRRPARRRDPRHIHHNEDETFYVLEGEVTVLVGDERIDLRRGDYCFAPRDIVHASIIRSERARFLTTLSPAGLEELFVTCGVPVSDDQPPTDAVMPPMDEMVRLFAGYGCDIVGPPPTLDEL